MSIKTVTSFHPCSVHKPVPRREQQRPRIDIVSILEKRELHRSATSAFVPVAMQHPAARTSQSAREIFLIMNPLKRTTICLYEWMFWIQNPNRESSSITKIHRYVLSEKLGSGTTGTVYAAFDRERQQMVAIKISQFFLIQNPHIRVCGQLADRKKSEAFKAGNNVFAKNQAYCDALMRELVFLRELASIDEVVKSIDWFYPRPYQIAIVLEKLPVSVLQSIQFPSRYPKWSIKDMAHFIFKMGTFLYKKKQKNIIHGDLKPENIMLVFSISKSPKVIDFGCAMKFDSLMTHRPLDYTTRWYRAPEVVLGVQDWGTEIDMWGLGCILFEMATGEVLFPSEDGVSPDSKLAYLQGLTNHLNFIARLIAPPPKRMFKKARTKDALFTQEGTKVYFKMEMTEGAKRILLKRQNEWTFFKEDRDLLRSRIKHVLSPVWPEAELALFADLVRKMVSYSRLSPSELLDHPFLATTLRL